MKQVKKSTVAANIVVISLTILIFLGFLGNPYTMITGALAFCAAVAAIIGLSLLKTEE